MEKVVKAVYSPFDKGYEGFKRNRTNPFNKDTHSYREWERGYNASYFDNLKLVKERENAKRK